MASSHIGSYVLVAIGSAIAWQVAAIIRNLYFHSLSRFPGPFIQRASGIPFAIQHCTGVQAFNTQKLHDMLWTCCADRTGPPVLHRPKGVERHIWTPRRW
ncbi:hypothetical protein F5Y18DRAFT_99683 [Xylariaceae sp. FL1019]|nr:hypothetical protein F5Y18DRAFT_99683 [Xylariaceae sp. FL1019]